MTTQAGTKVSQKAQAFCGVDCRYNPNGCGYCGRSGRVIGIRERGTVTVLSGRTMYAYRELTFMQGGKETWTIYLTNGLPARSASTIKSFRPDNSAGPA